MAYENNLWQFMASLKLRPFKAEKLWHIGTASLHGLVDIFYPEA